MTIVLWVMQGLLALVFLAAGARKLFQPIPTLAKRLARVADFPTWPVRLIGLAEVLGAAGLILPGVTHIAPVLTAAAAAGLAIVMVGAIIFHIVRREGSRIIMPVVLLLLTLFVVYGHFAFARLL